MKMNLAPQFMYEALMDGVCLVEFTKANGENRKMVCTLNSTIAPDMITDTEIKPFDQTKDLIHVWDLEVNGWRAFKPSTVLDFKNV